MNHWCYSPDYKWSVLTLSLCCSVLQAAWLWLCSVSRSRLHPSWKKARKKGDGEVHPQRDCYVMERLTEDYFVRGERGTKRRREWVIRSERRGDGDTSVREKVKVLFYSWTETDCRQRDFRWKLSRRSQPIGSSGWISEKVGRKCKVKPDGTFPWQQRSHSSHKLSGTLTIWEGGEKTIHRYNAPRAF